MKWSLNQKLLKSSQMSDILCSFMVLMNLHWCNHNCTMFQVDVSQTCAHFFFFLPWDPISRNSKNEWQKIADVNMASAVIQTVVWNGRSNLNMLALLTCRERTKILIEVSPNYAKLGTLRLRLTWEEKNKFSKKTCPQRGYQPRNLLWCALMPWLC